MIGVSEYFPQSNYGGGVPGAGSFEQQELSHVYGQSFDVTQMSLAAYKNYLGEAQDMANRFKGRLGVLEVQANRLRQDLLGAPSLVQEQVTQALDRNMKQQATVAASMAGPVGAVNALLMSKNAQQAHEMASTGVAEFIKEDIARKGMYYQQLAMNNQQVIQTLGGLSQASMQGMQIAQGFGASSLQTALGAAAGLANYRTNYMQQQINRDELQSTWNRALLDSQTNMTLDTMRQMGGIQQATIAAQANMQGSYIGAWARAYGDRKRYESQIYRGQLDYVTDIFRTKQYTQMYRDLAPMSNALDLARIMASQQNTEAAARMMAMAQGNMGPTVGGFTDAYNQQLDRTQKQASEFVGGLGGLLERYGSTPITNQGV